MDGTEGTKGKRTRKRKVRVRPETIETVKVAPTSAPAQSKKVNMSCLLGGAIVKANGPVTGQEYTFIPGRSTPVDSRDVKGLLARRTNPKRCCGGRSSQPQQMFGMAA